MAVKQKNTALKKNLAVHEETSINTFDKERVVIFSNCLGGSVEVPLNFDGERESAEVEINGIFYHFERIHNSLLSTKYKVDNDPEYQPQTDEDGYCFIIAPFSK